MPSGVKDIQLIELKDTISKLNKTISAQNDLISSLQKMLEERNAKDADKDQLIANLQAQLDYLKNKLFGSTSESRHNQIQGQLSIFDSSDSDEKPAEIIEPEIIKVQAHTKKRKPKATYDEIFADLPTRQIIVDTLSEEEKTCAICGTDMVSIGHEVIRTELVYTEPKLERIEYIATTYSCPKCKDTEEPQFIKDEGVPALIPGSYVSSSLAAHVMYYKYVMSVPLYRQEKDFKHLGANLSRTSMAHWIIHCSENYFQPMYDYMHRQLLKRRYLMADETPLQVLKEKERRPQSKSYVWLVRTGEDGEIPIILYSYTPTRAGKNAAEFLKDAEPGYFLMTDGYQGYNKVPEANRCCCWAHIRRYWLRAIPKGHEKDYTNPAVQGLLYCNKLFEYERSYREKGLSLKRIYNRRLKDEKPVIEAFLSWLDGLHPKTGDNIIRAITYTNNCRPYMMNYLKDGACSLSNNLSENSIRPLVVGRKNWLFSDTPAGAKASMNVYSMIETAKENELDPLKYLTFLLENRPNANMSEDELTKLAPWSEEAKKKCK
ncbi:MAG: IS66 family transposase [Lachnobacterium sp.]|nr:IS66 family transposase [Lachnobacterium sp.]